MENATERNFTAVYQKLLCALVLTRVLRRRNEESAVLVASRDK